MLHSQPSKGILSPQILLNITYTFAIADKFLLGRDLLTHSHVHLALGSIGERKGATSYYHANEPEPEGR